MTKADQAKSISAKLSSMAKAKGITFQSLSTTFLLERLLARLMLDVRLAKSLVFKGGYVGLRVYDSPRYTVDIDALLIKADVESALKRITKAIERDIDDGAWFKFESQVDLQTQGEYGGIRQVFRAGLGEPLKDVSRAQVINFDMGIGDPVTPEPVQRKIDELLGKGQLSCMVYPIETIVAEKLQTLVDRGGNNSRAKDIYDLQYYLPEVDPSTLQLAVDRCFKFRGTPIPSDLADFIASID